jgi:hypothetical protein
MLTVASDEIKSDSCRTVSQEYSMLTDEINYIILFYKFTLPKYDITQDMYLKSV